MDNTIEIICLIAALIISIASPIITSAINSWHEKRMYTFRFYDESKANALEEYALCTGRYLHFDTPETEMYYAAAYGKVLLYVSKDLMCKITHLDSQLQNADYDEDYVSILFNEICELLQKDFPRSKKK